MTGEGNKSVQSQIIRWLSIADTDVTPATCNWVYGHEGIMAKSPDMQRGMDETLKFMSWLNNELRLKTWLVGERISFADISLMSSLLLLYSNESVLLPKQRVG